MGRLCSTLSPLQIRHYKCLWGPTHNPLYGTKFCFFQVQGVHFVAMSAELVKNSSGKLASLEDPDSTNELGNSTKRKREEISEWRDGLDYKFNGGCSSYVVLRSRKPGTDAGDVELSDPSDSAYQVDKSSEDSVVSLGENEFDRMLREYEEHLSRVDQSPEIWDMHLSFDEFCCQQPIDEGEFGPAEDIYTIRRDCLDLAYLKKDMEREWRMRTNRFKEVQRRRKLRGEETEPEDEDENRAREGCSSGKA